MRRLPLSRLLALVLVAALVVYFTLLLPAAFRP